MNAAGPVAVMGGAFDPVHYGHLRTAVELIEELGLDELRFVPSANPPHRDPHIASSELRVQMLDAATAGLASCIVDDRELSRDGPSWTVLTLEELRREMPDRSLCMITGMDSFLGLESWHRWEELVELAHLVVARRPGSALPVEGVLGDLLANRGTENIADIHGNHAGHIYVAEVTQLEISSSAIRTRLQNSASVDFLLPPEVLALIRETECYSLNRPSVTQEQSLYAK